MLLSRIGGGLLLAACALLAVIGSIAAGHGAVGIGVAGIGGLAVTGVIGCLALGAGSLAVATPPDLRGRTIRVGLAMVAIGLAIVVPSATARMDQALIYGLIAGAGLAWVGAIITLVGLLWRRGPARRHATAFLAGLGVTAVGGGLASSTSAAGVLSQVGVFVALGGGVAMLLTLASVGLMALRGGPVARAPEVARR